LLEIDPKETSKRRWLDERLWEKKIGKGELDIFLGGIKT